MTRHLGGYGRGRQLEDDHSADLADPNAPESNIAHPTDAADTALPWSRFVALGDSFTEGVGDPEAESPGGLRGWADRFAEVLAAYDDDFAYANLAVRGKLIRQIAEEQVETALDLRPDLVSICAGGNDVIRPGTDPDAVADQLDLIASRLRESNATVLIFTGVDVAFQPVFRSIRGKVAIFNENVRKVAQRHDCVVVDQWAIEALQDSRYWAGDRLHLNALGHHTIAIAALDALNVPHTLEPLEPPEIPDRTWRQARTEDVVWAKEHLVPWVIRRLRHQSSGDSISAKRPQPTSPRRARHGSDD